MHDLNVYTEFMMENVKAQRVLRFIRSQKSRLLNSVENNSVYEDDIVPEHVPDCKVIFIERANTAILKMRDRLKRLSIEGF